MLHKVSKAVIVYSEDWEYLQSLNLNLSQEIRDFLHNLVATKEGNIDGINVKLERSKLNQNISKLSKLQNEINNSEDLIKRYEEKEQLEETKKLEQEKERISKETKCPNCHNVLTDETRKEIKKGTIICRTCSLNSDVVLKYLTEAQK